MRKILVQYVGKTLEEAYMAWFDDGDGELDKERGKYGATQEEAALNLLTYECGVEVIEILSEAEEAEAKALQEALEDQHWTEQ